jgi:peptide/nickel transport system permease protein
MRVPLLILGVILVAITLAPVLMPLDPMKTNPSLQFQPPGDGYFLGTDSLGRDVWSRVLYGGQSTLFMAVLATVIAIVPGIALGLLARAGQCWLDLSISTLMSALLAVPSLIVALVVLTLLGRGILSLSIAIGLSQIASCAAVTRAAVQSVRSLTYIEAGYGLGATHRHVLLHYILPNIQPTLLAYATIIFGYSVLNGAALSFLGLGGELGTPDWGVMLAEGRAAFRIAPWIGIAPGLAITATIWAVNALADQIGKR